MRLSKKLIAVICTLAVVCIAGCSEQSTGKNNSKPTSAEELSTTNSIEESSSVSEDTSTVASTEEASKTNTENTTYTYEDGVLTVLSQEFFTSDHPDFREKEDLKKIIYSEGVTDITIGCRGYKTLEAVEFPQSLEHIVDTAFNSCKALKEYTIPENAEFNYNAFYMTGWYIDQPDGDLYNGAHYMGYKGDMPENYTVNIKDGTKVIPGYVFSSNNQQPSEVMMPDSVKILCDWAFAKDENLKAITIPDSVEKIGECTFFNCSGLKSVTLGKGIKEIKSSTFANCTALETVEISDSIEKIDESAFANCPSIKDLTIPASVTTVEGAAFDGWKKDQTIHIKGRDSIPDTWSSIWQLGEANVVFEP